MRLAIEPIALFGEAKALQRVLDARCDRLEQGRLRLVEALVVETRHADDAARTASGERRADDSPCAEKAQVAAVITTRRLEVGIEETLLETGRRFLRAQPVGAYDAGASVLGAGEHEGDLGLEGLAQLGGDKLAELRLGLGPVHDRHDLRTAGSLYEAPPQLDATVSLAR